MMHAKENQLFTSGVDCVFFFFEAVSIKAFENFVCKIPNFHEKNVTDLDSSVIHTQ